MYRVVYIRKMDSGLDFVINSDPIVELAFKGGLGAVALALLMLLQIVALRIFFRRNERRKREFMYKWQDMLTESSLAQNIPLQLPPIYPGELVCFLSYWNHQYNSLSSEARKQLCELARTINIGQDVRRMLHKGSNAEKLLATIGIGFFGNETDLSTLRKLLVSERSIDCMHAAGAMLRINASTLSEVLPVMARRSDLSIAGMANFLEQLDPEKVSLALVSMIKRLQQVEPQQRIRRRDVVRLIMLSVTGVAHIMNPFLREIRDKTEDDEVLAACIKVMRDPVDLKKIRNYVGHPNWRVRVQAATALGEMGDYKDLSFLLQLLSDPQWWVRYRAAQAISSLSFMTVEYLEEIKKTLNDAFAIDMLNQIISERAL